MKTIFQVKQFSVFINGLIYAVFDTLEEARRFAGRRFGPEVVQIWDNYSQEEVLTEVIL